KAIYFYFSLPDSYFSNIIGRFYKTFYLRTHPINTVMSYSHGSYKISLLIIGHNKIKGLIGFNGRDIQLWLQRLVFFYNFFPNVVKSKKKFFFRENYHFRNTFTRNRIS